MFEIRFLSQGDNLPANVDYVLIEPTPSHTYLTMGVAGANRGAIFLTDEPCETIEQAYSAAKTWASKRDVNLLLFRNRR